MGKRAGCFAFKLAVSLMSTDNHCSVALNLLCVTVVFPDRTQLFFFFRIYGCCQNALLETIMISTNMFLKGYPLEAKTAPKN